MYCGGTFWLLLAWIGDGGTLEVGFPVSGKEKGKVNWPQPAGPQKPLRVIEVLDFAEPLSVFRRPKAEEIRRARTRRVTFEAILCRFQKICDLEIWDVKALYKVMNVFFVPSWFLIRFRLIADLANTGIDKAEAGHFLMTFKVREDDLIWPNWMLFHLLKTINQN